MSKPYLCRPFPLTVVDGGNALSVGPAANLLRDEPSMVWRSNGVGNISLTFQGSGAPVDTIALLFTNLRTTDTVQVRAANTVADTTGNPVYDSGVQVAFSGTCTAPHRPKTIITLEEPVGALFWRIDISAPNHPAGYVEAVRLVIGQRLDLGGQKAGIDWGCKFIWTDQSSMTTTNGVTYGQEWAKLPGWSITSSWITDDDWTWNYNPALGIIGNFKPVLMVPNPDGPYTQHEAVYGRITDGPLPAESAFKNGWTVDMTFLGITS
jgi:hypothetical protein